MSTTVLQSITLPGEALGWISTVLASVEEDIQDGLKWLPTAETSDAEIEGVVTGYLFPGADIGPLVELLKAMRDLDVAINQCRLPSTVEART